MFRSYWVAAGGRPAARQERSAHDVRCDRERQDLHHAGIAPGRRDHVQVNRRHLQLLGRTADQEVPAQSRQVQRVGGNFLRNYCIECRPDLAEN